MCIRDRGALDHLKQAGGGERRRDSVLLFKVELLVFLVQVNASVGHGQQSDPDFFHPNLILSRSVSRRGSARRAQAVFDKGGGGGGEPVHFGRIGALSLIHI